MKLLTKAIEKKIKPLYTYESTPSNKVPIAVKFFTPDANWTWYVTEGEKQGDDWLFFGYVEGFEGELGYFRLSELKSIRGPLGLPVERDMYFGKNTLEDVMRGVARNPGYDFTVTDEDGFDWYVKVIDSTHIKFGPSPEALEGPMNVYHIAELKGEIYYDDIVNGINDYYGRK